VLRSTATIEFPVDFKSGGPGFESRAAHQLTHLETITYNQLGVGSTADLLSVAQLWHNSDFSVPAMNVFAAGLVSILCMRYHPVRGITHNA
jgi:hypothetical protein